MDNVHVVDRLKHIVPEIVSEYPSIRVIYLFGSHASGEQKPGSDLDIAVYTDGTESALMDIELGADLEQKLKCPVDIVIMQKVSPIIQYEVLKNKILLYETNLTERTFLEVGSFRDYLDVKHYQKKRARWRRFDGKRSVDQTVVK